MSDLQTNDQQAFTETFCQRCRNPECSRAQWSVDRFQTRIATQADRLLNPKNQIAQQDSSRYEGLSDFVDMAKQALTLEISARRNDWTIPGQPQPRSFMVSVESVKPELPKAVPEREELGDVVEPSTEEAGVSRASNVAFIPVLPNTPPPPPEGIMVDGGIPPASIPLPVAALTKPVDDWSPPKAAIKKVAPGAKIKLGGSS